MPKVIALRSFDHAGVKRKGETFEVTEPTAKEMARRDLARIIDEKQGKEPPAGNKSSASQAGQASQKKISKKSKSGDNPAGAEPLSSPTPAGE